MAEQAIATEDPRPDFIKLSPEAEAELVKAIAEKLRTEEMFRGADHDAWQERENKKLDLEEKSRARHSRHIHIADACNVTTIVALVAALAFIVRTVS